MLFDFTDFWHNTAIISDKGKKYTYAQLQTEADILKSEFHKGELAFCLCTNTPESIIGYVALMQSGVTTVLLDANKNEELLNRLLELYQPNLIWTKTGGQYGKIVKQFGNYSLFRYSEWPHTIHPDVALLLTTSGSTGSPKLVKLTVKNLQSNAEAIAEYLCIDENERPITMLPMYYSFGMSVINSHLIKGATILLTDTTLMQKEFWDFLKEGKATSIAGVPYTYEMLRRLHFSRMELPSLKTMIQAGGKLNTGIVKEFIIDAHKKGRKFIVMYGQTEAAPRMSWLPFEYALEKYTSIGVAIPGGKLSLYDIDGNEITLPNVEGELIFKGPNVSMGYAECLEDLAAGDKNNGVLHTGDIARVDEDGFFYITGRMKRFVKVWGNRCNLDATEQLVKEITANCACVGVDDKITIFITEKGIEKEIISYLVEKTGLHFSAFEIRVILEIPKTNTGKINYPILQQWLS